MSETVFLTKLGLLFWSGHIKVWYIVKGAVKKIVNRVSLRQNRVVQFISNSSLRSRSNSTLAILVVSNQAMTFSSSYQLFDADKLYIK